MKLTLLAFLLLSLIGIPVIAFAEAPTNAGPEIIRFKMGDLTLPFKHWLHQKRLPENKRCFPCHTDGVGKIKNWGEETAHSLCITCHEIVNKGPVECRYCHTGLVGKK